MSRSVSSLSLVLVFLCCPLVAADKQIRQDVDPQAEAVAREQVQQALRAESLGDNEQRTERLAAAFLAAPQAPVANWHQARVQCEGEWLPVALAVHRRLNDPNSKKYSELRERVVRSDSVASGVKALRDLAAWCLRTGSRDVARVHYAQLLAHPAAEPDHKKEAIKALDLHEVNGALVSGEELAQRREAAQAIDKGFAKWEVPLRKLREQIDGESDRPRQKALDELAQLDDPAILPVLESLLPEGGERFHLAVIERLKTFPQYEATVTLARCAVLSNYQAAREAATSALRERPLNEYVPLLLAELAAPLKSQFRIGWDARGRIGYAHTVLQEGLSDNRLLVLSSISRPNFQDRDIVVDNRQLGTETTPVTSTTTFGGNGKTPYEAFREEVDNLRLQAAQREAQVRQVNAAVERANQRIYQVLEEATGEKTLAREPAAWSTWWQSYNDYKLSRPTQYAYRHNEYVYSSLNYSLTTLDGTIAPRSNASGPRPRYVRPVECFLKGTPVRTDRGLLPIETILPGDRVLSQDQDSGELTFKPVLAATLRPPGKMLRVRAGGEEIVTTLGHPFWVSGRGWRMAKQLQPGHLLHGLGGAVTIESVEPLPDDQPAHNLVVDGFNTYFVGQAGLLVHDNEFRRPTTSIVPGLPGNN
jgi:hypothetical protein